MPESRHFQTPLCPWLDSQSSQLMPRLLGTLCKWTHTSQGHQTQLSSSDSSKHHPMAHPSPKLPHKPWGPFPETSTNTSPLRVLLRRFLPALQNPPPATSQVSRDSSLQSPSQVPYSPRWTCVTPAPTFQFRVFHLPSYTHRPSLDHPHSSTPPNWSFHSEALPHRFLRYVLGTPSLHSVATHARAPPVSSQPGWHTPSSWDPSRPSCHPFSPR